MSGFRERAKNALPTVLLTLASIIQALALEVFWARISGESPYLWEPGPFLWAGWAQCASVFLGILVIWIYYANLVMRFRWVPEVRDSVIPFIFGITEFALVETMGPDMLKQWFLLFGFIFAFAAWASHTTFARARLEPENEAFFSRLSVTPLAQHGPQLVPTVVLCGFAAVIPADHPGSVVVLVSTWVAAAFMLMQLWLQGVYWKRTLAVDDKPPDGAG